MVHICLVTPYPANDGAVLGGVEAASLRLVQALVARKDVKVTVVAPAAASATECRGAVNIVWVASRPAFLPGIVRYWTFERRSLLRAVKRIQPDVVHFQAMAGWGIGCRLPRLFQMHGVPEDAVMHTERRTKRISRWVHLIIERIGRRSFPMAAVVGEHMIKRFGSQFTGEVFLAENTVPDFYFEIEREPVKGRVLFGGVISRRKNVLGLLQAFGDVVNKVPDAVLHLAGEMHSFPTYVQECRNYVTEHGLSKNVEFLGPLTIDEVAKELAEAAVLVLPSFNESAPIIICEAMAAGVPVITSRRDGMVWMVEDGKTGFLVEPEDTASMFEFMVELLQDGGRNRVIGDAARNEARRRFSATALATLMTEKYAALAGGER